MTPQEQYAVHQYRMCCRYLGISQSYKKGRDSLFEKVIKTRDAIQETLRDNLHLADGDDCTLKKLKDALKK